MKSKSFLLLKSILFVFFFLGIAAYAFVELNKEETFTIESPSFFPFSSSVNTQVKEQISTNPLYDISFLNLSGGPLTVSAAADSQEFGLRLTVTTQGIFTVDFSTTSPGATSLGLSFVPLEGSSTFTFSVSPHLSSPEPISDITSSSSGGQSALLENVPNSIVIFSIPLIQQDATELFNLNNFRCQNNSISINGQEGNDILNVENSLDNLILNRYSSQDPNHMVFILNPLGSEGGFFVNDLINGTDTTQIYLTAIFPSIVENTSVTDSDKIVSIDQRVDLGKQNFKTTKDGGFYSTINGECLSPYCAFINSDEVLFFPNGSCTPEVVTKKSVKYNQFILPDFLSQLPSDAKISEVGIDMPFVSGTEVISMIINTNVIKERANVIFQAVPANSRVRQVLTITAAAKKKRQCSENSTSRAGFCGENNAQCVSKEFLGKCCEANSDGTVKRICHPANAFTCNCTENFAGTAFAISTSVEPEEDDKPRKCRKEFLCGGCKNNGKCCLADEKLNEVARCGPTPFAPGMCSCQAI